jgi:hypothetical protein
MTPNLISQVEELTQPFGRSIVASPSVGHFTDQLSLPRDRDLAVAGQSCHRALVPEILTPSLEFLNSSTVSLREDC